MKRRDAATRDAVKPADGDAPRATKKRRDLASDGARRRRRELVDSGRAPGA